MASTSPLWQTIEAKGAAVVDKVKDVIAEGNVRRVRVRQHDNVVAEFPLTFGLAGVALAPIFAAIATLVALLTHCSIDVERDAPDPTND